MSDERWGVLDSEDLWMGTTDGPLTYDTELMARVLATILYEQFEHAKAFRAAPFTGATKIRDELTPRLTTLDAIKLAEGERLPRRRA